MSENIHNPFDVVMKRIVEADPLAMLHFVGLEGRSAEPFDAELSTISPQADYVLRVHDPEYLGHFEFLSGYRSEIGSRQLVYAATTFHNHKLLVESVLMLLRPQAEGPAITGAVQYGETNVFHYKLVRLWETPPESILTGPPALLPLLPLTAIKRDDIPAALDELKDHINPQPDPGDLWAKTMLLMGLIFDADHAKKLLEGVMRDMRDSSTYQAILDEGRQEGWQTGWQTGRLEGRLEADKQVLYRLGARKFGEPDAGRRIKIEAITSADKLDLLIDRLLDASSWEDLLR